MMKIISLITSFDWFQIVNYTCIDRWSRRYTSDRYTRDRYNRVFSNLSHPHWDCRLTRWYEGSGLIILWTSIPLRPSNSSWCRPIQLRISRRRSWRMFRGLPQMWSLCQCLVLHLRLDSGRPELGRIRRLGWETEEWWKTVIWFIFWQKCSANKRGREISEFLLRLQWNWVLFRRHVCRFFYPQESVCMVCCWSWREKVCTLWVIYKWYLTGKCQKLFSEAYQSTVRRVQKRGF
jgi:hypothetical protein